MNKAPDKRDHLALYSSNCKICKALDASERKTFRKCHYTAGNRHCPASEVRIVIVGQAYRMAEQVLRARAVRDAEAESKILTAVATHDPDFRERFYHALENPLESNE